MRRRSLAAFVLACAFLTPVRAWESDEAGVALSILAEARRGSPVEVFEILRRAQEGRARAPRDAGGPAGRASGAAGRVEIAKEPLLPRAHFRLANLPARTFFREVLADPLLTDLADGAVDADLMIRFRGGEWVLDGTFRFDALALTDPSGRFRVAGLTGEVPVRIVLGGSGGVAAARRADWGRVEAEAVEVFEHPVAIRGGARARYENGRLSLAGLSADALGGRLEAAFAIRGAADDPQTALLLDLGGVDLAEVGSFLWGDTEVAATGRVSGRVSFAFQGTLPVRAEGTLHSTGPGEVRIPEVLRRRVHLPASFRYRRLEVRFYEGTQGAPHARITIEAQGAKTLTDLLRGAPFNPPRFVFDLPLAPLLR